MKIILRNISQAYTQSKTELNRTVICYLPAKLMKRYHKGTVLRIVKLLYGLAEVGDYWFATYLDYHKDKVEIDMLPYDTCFFITKNDGENFSIV